MKNKKVYIMLSQTHTALGLLIQNVLDTEYNHCSIALGENPNIFYSFGRKKANNFLYAGFVFESKDFGFFKVFSHSRVCILELSVSDEQYTKVKSVIEYFTLHRDSFSFNITGLALAKLAIPYGGNTQYFCSQFVSEVLAIADIHKFQKDCRLVTPPDMFDIPDTKVIYAGQIKDYNPQEDLYLHEAIAF